jgi:hypothetical protein
VHWSHQTCGSANSDVRQRFERDNVRNGSITAMA